MLMSAAQAYAEKNKYIQSLEDVSKKIRKNFNEMDIENVTLYDDMDAVVIEMEGKIAAAIEDIRAISFES